MTQATLFDPQQWLPVPGYEENYLVSDWGYVWSQPRATTRGGIMKQTLDPRGYMLVTLTLNGRQRQFQVHRLVMLAFVGECPQGHLTRHLNGYPAGNMRVNLQYGTPVENAQDMLEHGRCVNANKTCCPRKHEYTPENTYRLASGSRGCRECARIKARVNSRNYAARQRAARGSLERACEFCGTLYTPKRRDGRYCSRQCSRRHNHY